METDKRYFIEGLFIIVFSLAAAFFLVWLADTGRRDDVLYRIYFADSVSGLALGEPVKYRGVDVGAVETMALDPADPRRVRVDIKLSKDAPVKTDTRATLRLKGLTGAVFIELNGGDPKAPTLLAATPEDQIPEIPSAKSSLHNFLEQLPKVLEKFSAIEDKTSKVLSDVGATTARIKEDPSLLLRRPKEKSTPTER